jgi:glycosyltransferase involved in cell wall biosynthesis
MSDRITFLGRVPHARVIDLTKKAICLVVPSEWLEGFPHVLLEAFACGVPIVASRIGTLADVVKDGHTGLLFDPGEADLLAAAVERLYKDPALAEKCGYQARREYLDKYTAVRNYQQLIAIYENLLEGSNTTPSRLV